MRIFINPMRAMLALIIGLVGYASFTPAASADQTFPIAFTGIGIYPRTEPSMDAPHAGDALPDGTMVTIECELEGQAVNNGMATISIWAKTNVGYLPNAYLYTGVDGWTPGVGRCSDEREASKAAAPVPAGASQATEWARTHYSDPARFDPDRGDCTWFVSQALWAGGLPKSEDWTDISTDWSKIPNPLEHGWRGVTKSGRYAPALREYLISAELAQERRISWSDNTASGAAIGDLIFYDYQGDGEWDHVAIVTSLNESGFPTVTEHLNAERYWSWSEASVPGRWIEQVAPSAVAVLLKVSY